jgi:hypothetical protein
MEDHKHPFERLPEPWQAHPVVLRAWLQDLSHSRTDSHHGSSSGGGKKPLVSPLMIRAVVLAILAMTSLGIIKPEHLIKLLPILVKLMLGVPA